MKKSIYILILLFTGSAAFAQDMIEGIGKLKIGKPVSVTDEIAEELNSKLKTIDNSMDVYLLNSRKPQIVELVANKKQSYSSPAYVHACPSARVFYINSYTIAGINIKEIYLTFENDKLVDVSCNNSTELTEALNAKYGTPKLETERKTAKCLYKMTGNEVELEEETFTSSWENGPIKANAVLMKYYNDKCEKKYINSFNVGLAGVISDINDCDREIAKKESETKKSEIKSKLADF